MMTQGLKLMVDDNHFDKNDYLVESIVNPETKAKQLYVSGPFSKSGERNRNGRIYPHDLLSQQIKEFDENFIKKKRALGCLEHPDSPVIDSNLAALLITEMHEDGPIFHGKARVLSLTPKGAILAGLLNEGVQMGMSSRALGDVDDAGNVTNLQLITYDCVLNPSCSVAYVNGILESREFICKYNEKNERIYEELDKGLEKMPNTYNKALVEEYLVQKVMAFMARL